MPSTRLLLMLCLLLTGCEPTPKALHPKTLIVGMDGVQLAQYERLGEDTYLRTLHYGKAYTGGISGRASEQRTLSGPGWITLLTGVWANKHGVTSNDVSQRVDPAFPSLFKRLRQALPSAYISLVSSWDPLNTALLLEDAQGNDVRISGLADAEVIQHTLKIINETSADFTFIQLDEPDQVGHRDGFGASYSRALKAADDRLGLLLQAIKKRSEQKRDEDWLVIVSTDHGRDAGGKDHGGASEQEKTVFIASNKPMNEELTEPSIPEDNPGPNNLYSYAAQASVAPTVLRHMGLTLLAQWKLDGTPLLGATGVRKARAQELNARLRWNSASTADVTIYKNGQPTAQVPASAREWIDPAGMGQVNDYVLELDDTPAAVRIRPASRPFIIEAVAY